MSLAPKTRNSLILRLRNREDVDSWREFAAIYQPVIYRVARHRGMQDADAHELVQRVLLAVARAVDRFQPDKSRAKFRTWLYRITHNEFCKELENCRKYAAAGDSAVRELLERVPEATADEFSMEYRRSVFRWAADRVRPDVKPTTWEAFWRTSVSQESTEDVAKELGISTGAVYIARSRVMARLQREAAKFGSQS
jgi:RNA polymerase sigma-70 factor (ECF subfamily)